MYLLLTYWFIPILSQRQTDTTLFCSLGCIRHLAQSLVSKARQKEINEQMSLSVSSLKI